VHQAPGGGRAAPELAPEHGEDLDLREQRPVAIREPGIRRGRVWLAIEEILRLSFTPEAAELVDRVGGLRMVQRRDAHVLFGGELFRLRLSCADCSHGHLIPPGSDAAGSAPACPPRAGAEAVARLTLSQQSGAVTHPLD